MHNSNRVKSFTSFTQTSNARNRAGSKKNIATRIMNQEKRGKQQ